MEQRKNKTNDNIIKNKIKELEAQLYEKGEEYANTTEIYNDVTARMNQIPLEFDALLAKREVLCELIGWEGDRNKMRIKVVQSLQVEAQSDNIS